MLQVYSIFLKCTTIRAIPSMNFLGNLVSINFILKFYVASYSIVVSEKVCHLYKVYYNKSDTFHKFSRQFSIHEYHLKILCWFIFYCCLRKVLRDLFIYSFIYSWQININFETSVFIEAFLTRHKTIKNGRSCICVQY